MAVEFEDGVRQFFITLQDSLAINIEISQIWSLDSQGFHAIYSSTEATTGLGEVARQACIKHQLIFEQNVFAFPFKLNARQSGALVIVGDKLWTEQYESRITDAINQRFEPLEQLLSTERFARLSGLAQRADWLGKAISLAYKLEYADDTKPIYLQIHHALKQLMYAENLFVTKSNATGDSLTFEYLCDQHDDNAEPIPIGVGVLQGSLSAYVVKSGRVIRGPSNELAKEMGYGGGPSYGEEANDWLGVPLALGQQVYGAIVVQSYDPDIYFDDQDPNILAVLAEALATSFQRRQIREQLQQKVEQRTKELAQTVASLEASIEAQKQLQDELVEAEKQAALGRLVTGVAHELNTPLGICVTANSIMTEQIRESAEKFSAGNFKKTDLVGLFDTLKSSGALFDSNLARASVLIERFKQISSQPMQLEKCRFNVGELITEVAAHFNQSRENQGHYIDLKIEGAIEATSYPAALMQVLQQLIDNSVVHGFSDKSKGVISLKVQRRENNIEIMFEDNGLGLSDEVKAKAFDPFFTTKRCEGRVGIGLHIVSNLINHTLKGSILLEDNSTEGIRLQLSFACAV